MKSVFYIVSAYIGIVVAQHYGPTKPNQHGPPQIGRDPIKTNAIPQHLPPKQVPIKGPAHYSPPHGPPPHGPPHAPLHYAPPPGHHEPPHGGPRKSHHLEPPMDYSSNSSDYDGEDDDDDDDDGDEDALDALDDDEPSRHGPTNRKHPGYWNHKRPGPWKHHRPRPSKHHKPRPWDDDYDSSSSPSDSDYDSSSDHHHGKHPCNRPFTKHPPNTPKNTRFTPPYTKSTRVTPPYTKSTRVTPPYTKSTRVTPPYTKSTRVTPPYTKSTRVTPPYTKSTRVTTPSTISTRFTPPYSESTKDTTPSTISSRFTPPYTESTRVTPPSTKNTISPNEGKTTLSPDIQNCIDTCPSTPEYNPVCGTNGQTYKNHGKLLCAARCGVDVKLQRSSACPPPNPNVSTSTSTASTVTVTVTNTPSIARSTPGSSFQSCMRQCHITGAFQPVCGSDLVTYMNIDRLKCAQSCGEIVQVLCDKPCAACGFNPVPTAQTETTIFTTATENIGKSTQEPNVQDCINACPTTSEYNPVCGSDKVTYKNPSHLICAQLCGVSVNVARFSPCPTASSTSTTTELPVITDSSDVQGCIKACHVTSQYDPVCGSNGLTYKNIGQLECARYCGVDVEFKQKSNCDSVDGSKDEVTVTSQTTGITTASWITTGNSTPTTPGTITSTSGSSTTLGFTVPGDVLEEIFGTSTVQPTVSTKTSNPNDEDEDLDIDHRFKEEDNKDRHARIIYPE